MSVICVEKDDDKTRQPAASTSNTANEFLLGIFIFFMLYFFIWMRDRDAEL